VFNKLTNNGATKGIWLGDVTGDGIADLYISANYISTGTLTSENNNMYIDLDNGKIWSKNFELFAENSENNIKIILSNNPIDNYYFFIGVS
jgi:hypothetical protein